MGESVRWWKVVNSCTKTELFGAFWGILRRTCFLKKGGSFTWVKVCLTMLMMMFASLWWGFSRFKVPQEGFSAEK